MTEQMVDKHIIPFCKTTKISSKGRKKGMSTMSQDLVSWFQDGIAAQYKGDNLFRRFACPFKSLAKFLGSFDFPPMLAMCETPFAPIADAFCA